MFMVVFVSLLRCSSLIFLFLLLQVLLFSSALVCSLFSLHTTPGFHWRADRWRKALLVVFEHHASSPKQVEGEERKGDQSSVALRVISSVTLLFHAVWRAGRDALKLLVSNPHWRVQSGVLALLYRYTPPSLLPSLRLSMALSVCLLQPPAHGGFKKRHELCMYVQYVCVCVWVRHTHVGDCGYSSCITCVCAYVQYVCSVCLKDTHRRGKLSEVAWIYLLFTGSASTCTHTVKKQNIHTFIQAELIVVFM